ncbi:MAG: hypothetical protein CMI63_17905 [Parvularcula sp.]|nr:hypothetical protein [Parvularcula sp.]
MIRTTGTTLYACLREVEAIAPDAEAVICGARRLTYAQLRRETDRYARALLANGVGRGDRVAMLSTSRLEYWLVFLASAAIGAIWVGLGTRNRIEELQHVVDDVEPKLLIGLAEFDGRDYRPDLIALAGAPSVETLTVFGGECAEETRFEEFLARGDQVDNERLEAAIADAAPHDPALIVFTSGTTGKPKGAMLSQHGLTKGNRARFDEWDGPAPRMICALPINHIACVGDTCCMTLLAGGAIVFAEKFDPAWELATVEREKLTVWGGFPTMIQMTMAHPAFETTDFSSVYMVGWGGAALARPLIERLAQVCERSCVVYGLTETTCNVTWSAQGETLDAMANSIGRPGDAFECRIVDDFGKICGVGAPGEIQFRADTNMLGYWRRPEATADAFAKGGWLRTGDIGYWREDGNISLAGRRSDMFKSGGFNIYPKEVEQMLETHDAVETASVVSHAEELYGEVGAAFVVLKAGAKADQAELALHLRERLANYKVPKAITIVDRLPILANGKVDRKQLSAIAQKAYDGSR